MSEYRDREMQTQLGKPNPIQGIAMLIAGNCVLSAVLLGLQGLFPSAEKRLVVLMLTNAFVGISGFLWNQQTVLLFSDETGVAVFIWVPAACLAYTAFLVYPAQLPLSLFTIASALAPPLAAWILIRVRNLKDGSFDISTLVSMFLLIVLAIVEGHFASGANVVALFCFVLGCHTAAQFGLRSTAHETQPPLVSAVVSLAAAVILLGIITARAPTILSISGTELLVAFGFAPCIVLLQFLHLSGLRASTLAMGAIGMNTAVPIAILCEKLYSKHFHVSSIAVSLLYVISVLWRSFYMFSRKVR